MKSTFTNKNGMQPFKTLQGPNRKTFFFKDFQGPV